MRAILIDNDGFMTAAYPSGKSTVIIFYGYDGSVKDIKIR
jgi:hypothetical protein